jgi:CRISPR-associated protein Cmr3
MITKKYLVKLTPYDKFFFGGEKTFGENNQANYFVVSNYFPQQTGVLGLIRHQLLLQCDNETIFKENKIVSSGASNLIGQKSFTIGKDFDFGLIKSLSPIFICDSNANNTNDAYYFPANKEYHWHEKLNKVCKKEVVKKFLQISLNPHPLLIDYKAKFGLPDLLMNKNGKLIQYNDVFKKHKQVGIRKKYDGGTDEKAYYIQTFFRFGEDVKKSNYSFSFITELDEKAKFSSQEIVVFGGEQQIFKMEVVDFDSEFENLTPNYKISDNSDKVVLVNDAYVTGDILKLCEFAVTDTVDFRFLTTSNNTEEQYYSKKPDKSRKYNLYKKGSVFYGDTNKIAIELENEQLQKIGYNSYKVIKK